MKKGISLLELMIGIAILGILAKLGLMFYTDQIRRTNKELAIQTLHQNVNKMEYFYSKNGSYLESGNTWPGSIIVSVVGVSGLPVYSVTFYPSVATSENKQAYCLVASPLGNGSQSDQITMYSDRYGTVTSTIPSSCSTAVVSNSLCPSGGSYSPCSGNCSGGIYSACSGNCNNVTICEGGTGCSGNCTNSAVYGGCSGNCNNTIIYGGCSGNCRNSTIYGSCSGSCGGSTCCSGGGCSSC